MLVWGICVGVILFFKNIKNQGSGVFFVFSIVIERNVYGSQFDSFKKEVFVLRFNIVIECVFIRVLKIVEVVEGVEVLVEFEILIVVF